MHMSSTDQTGDQFEWARAGEPGAEAELYARYASRLARLAEQHLSRKLAGRMDGEDVVQSVFRTFFRRSAAGQFQIDSSMNLWRLLVKITVLKARAKGRHHTAGVRDVGAEAGAAVGDGLAEAMATEPGPAEAAAFIDQIETLLLGLPPFYRQLLELRLAGEQVADVARQLSVSRQTVYRALKLLQARLLHSGAVDLPNVPKEKL
jgi:RNA polymerase sigma-70 factor (ECF subfamily)